MTHFTRVTVLLAATAVATIIGAAQPAAADDFVKMTIGRRGNWDTAVPHLGEKAGIFKKHGLTLEMVKDLIQIDAAQK